eukprot:14725732-Ditylum_brightwellii.AAC.1
MEAKLQYVHLEQWDLIEFVQSDALGRLKVHNNTGDLVLFLLVNLATLLEESGVDIFVDFGVGTTNGFFVELDNMMVPECSFW